MEYMLIEKGHKYNKEGSIHQTRSGDWIPLGYEQIGCTNTYGNLNGAIAKRKAILNNPDWGYENGDILIAKFEILDK